MTQSNLLSSIADAYASAEHTPHVPHVRQAYDVLKSQLRQQFSRLRLDVTFTDSDPYACSAAMFAAIEQGKLSVFRGGSIPLDHPMAERAPNGETYNCVFRAVHDSLAHFPERNSFSIRGECRAFRAHARLLSPLAVQAIATETIGQTAHYARHHTFAEQKAMLLPARLINAALRGID